MVTMNIIYGRKNKIGAFSPKTKAPIFSVATLYKLIYILNQIKPISQVYFKNHLSIMHQHNCVQRALGQQMFLRERVVSAMCFVCAKDIY
ncbi:hypothetical protein ACZ11_02005 [Lysinibacillus xylanilyticus]|uniref:Uncharacterized protein n=1 Tax=Lysinibacillus xylanilyticus TaxID=582475 RepID=A0A0K9FI18_9BACI|nr:hypothetical protein ACZ11_02005 [Lysinibacillus xylanilyticus]